MAFHVVLVEPEIPANTGNIARTCAATGTYLHLVRPLGFSTDDRYLKRAGLDYWEHVKIFYHDSIDEVLETYHNHRFFFATTKTKTPYSMVKFQDGDFIVFGKETAGLPLSLLQKYWNNTITIPMGRKVRSLNLANSVAIVLYEALRQTNFIFEE